MIPWFIATEPFNPTNGEAWGKYVRWSGINHLEEIVSLDPLLCPTVLSEMKDSYWPHVVNEDYMLSFFLDFEFFRKEIAAIPSKNVLCVFRNPPYQPSAPNVGDFDFLGYDLVDFENSASALTNCGGFPDVFSNAELSSVGLLPHFERALEVQNLLRVRHPEEFHANCHIWAIFRAKDY